MSIFRCKMCGGDLEIIEGSTVAECEYCGTKQTVPTANDENLQNLFNRANTLRIKCEFDKAEKIYERIIQEDSTQADAYWGLILCKYGIEYVDDPKTFKKIPTCHRTSFDSIVADEDYKSALEYADTQQREIYEEQTKEIDRIQKEILALAQKEENYDVFICYKETDSKGKRTQDSVIANDIYYQLTQEGFKAFYSAITLEGKLGSMYEPIIFAAINSAKVMLVIGTKPEYFNAVWVKNEWSRYLRIIKKDRSKLLIPCYRDMDAYELPDEFAHLQAQDMSKIGFINDIVRGIKKVVRKEANKTSAVKETLTTSAVSNTAPLLKRAFMFLEDGEFVRADNLCEQVLNQDPENARAYLGKLMAELKVENQDSLKDYDEPFDHNYNYEKAIRFANGELKATLEGYIDHIKTRNENARIEGIYIHAKDLMERADSANEYKDIALIFESIKGYKDSDEFIEKCYEIADELIENARKNAIYCRALSRIQGKNNIEIPMHSLETALEEFESISGWKDADERIAECRQKIDILKAYEEELWLEKERLAELEQIRLEKVAKRKKRNRKIAAISTPILCAIIALIIVINTVILPLCQYNKAIELIESGEYIEAYETLIALDDYKDSAEKAGSIYKEYNLERLKAAKVGDSVEFGAYEQDNDLLNGKENIEWIVLDVNDSKVLVISKYALDFIEYNKTHVDITWENCTLRTWLNVEFLNSAFSDTEKIMIAASTVSAGSNPNYSTDPGNETIDRIFLLSIAEASLYFDSDEARKCQPTKYAANKVKNTINENYNCSWWLRTPGGDQKQASAIHYHDGRINDYGNIVSRTGNAVRPAMWIDIDRNWINLDKKYAEALEMMENGNYAQAITIFAELDGYKDSAKKIDESQSAELDKWYNNAIALMNEKKYTQAIFAFEALDGYEDSESNITECRYSLAVLSMNEGKYQEAIGIFETLGDYKDTKNITTECYYALATSLMNEGDYKKAKIEFEKLGTYKESKNNIVECEYNIAIELSNEGHYQEAIAALQKLDGYKNSAKLIRACYDAILGDNYNDAIALMNAKKYKEAAAAFKALGSYRDSAERMDKCYSYVYGAEAWYAIKNVNVGSTLTFGSYEQDNYSTNGKEKIVWNVIDKKENMILVISKYALDCKPYNISASEVTWETCTLRTWLNVDFVNSAFTSEEKAMIPSVSVSADKNPSYNTDPGKATLDKVFLLSVSEINRYLGLNENKKCEPTKYAKAQGLSYSVTGNICYWWTRTPGFEQDYAAYVLSNGVNKYGVKVSERDNAIRPAMWIDLSKFTGEQISNSSISEDYKAEKLKSANVGDYVLWGKYEQDNNITNGKENIEWLVLEADESKFFVISRYALDCQPFDTDGSANSWEDCSLRNWLNNNFYNTAFSSTEKSIIPSTVYSDDINLYEGSGHDGVAQDKVFLLSVSELKKYFPTNEDRKCEPTTYASTNRTGFIIAWWTRSPSVISYAFPVVVSTNGSINVEYGYSGTMDSWGIRPAMWIDISKLE